MTQPDLGFSVDLATAEASREEDIVMIRGFLTEHFPEGMDYLNKQLFNGVKDSYIVDHLMDADLL